MYQVFMYFKDFNEYYVLTWYKISQLYFDNSSLNLIQGGRGGTESEYSISN